MPEIDKLKDIKCCPDCGNKKIESVEVRNQHANGEWNEFIKFGCGHQVHYSPNFMRNEITGECTSSKTYKEKKQKRNDFVIKLHGFVNDDKTIDPEFKKRVLSQIDHLSIY